MSNMKANLYNVYIAGRTAPIPVVSPGLDGIAQVLMDEKGVLPNLTEIEIAMTDVIMPVCRMPEVHDYDGDMLTLYLKDGERFLRFHLGKVDILIDLYDAPTPMTWYNGMKYALQKEMRLFTKEEGMAMYIYKDAINSKLRELGGAPLHDSWYHTATEYTTTGAWLVGFRNGYVGGGGKYGEGYVRAVAAFPKIGA